MKIHLTKHMTGIFAYVAVFTAIGSFPAKVLSSNQNQEKFSKLKTQGAFDRSYKKCGNLEKFKKLLENALVTDSKKRRLKEAAAKVLKNPYCLAEITKRFNQTDTADEIETMSAKTIKRAAQAEWTDETEIQFKRFYGFNSGMRNPYIFGSPDNIKANNKELKERLKEKLSNLKKKIEAQNNTLYVLSLDGGGIKGIVPTKILIALQEKFKKIPALKEKNVADVFDVIVGTSTGGLIALFLSASVDDSKQYQINDALNIYTKRGKEIFNRGNFIRKFLRTPRMILGFFNDVWSKYSAKNLEFMLRQYFGNQTLADTHNFVMTTSVEPDSFDVYRFNTLKALRNSQESNHYLWQAGRSTTAAPTYFKPYFLPTKDGLQELVDGGIAVNNPSLEAYVYATSILTAIDLLEKGKPGFSQKVKIVLVSVGTGKAPIAVKGKKAQRVSSSLVKVTRRTLKTLMASSSENATTAAKGALGENYIRLNVLFGKGVLMDKVGKKDIRYLEESVDSALKDKDGKKSELEQRLTTAIKKIEEGFEKPEGVKRRIKQFEALGQDGVRPRMFSKEDIAKLSNNLELKRVFIEFRKRQRNSKIKKAIVRKPRTTRVRFLKRKHSNQQAKQKSIN